MAAPDLSPELFAFHQSFNGGTPITDDVERDRFTQGFAERARVIDRRWGRKARDGNAPISTDTIAYWLDGDAPELATDGQVDVRDLINGSTGAVQWLGAGDPRYDNIRARWIPVTPASQPGDGGPGEGPGSDELTQLFEDVARIANGIETITALLISIASVAEDTQRRGVLVRFR